MDQLIPTNRVTTERTRPGGQGPWTWYVPGIPGVGTRQKEVPEALAADLVVRELGYMVSVVSLGVGGLGIIRGGCTKNHISLVHHYAITGASVWAWSLSQAGVVLWSAMYRANSQDKQVQPGSPRGWRPWASTPFSDKRQWRGGSADQR